MTPSYIELEKLLQVLDSTRLGTKKEALDMFLGELSPEMNREYMKCKYLARKLTTETHFTQYLKGEEYLKNSASFVIENPKTDKNDQLTKGGLFRDTANRWTKLKLHENIAATVNLSEKLKAKSGPN